MFFRCDICDFTFERKNRLSKHFKIHIRNFDFVFDKITKSWANHTFSTTFYLQYLTNSIIRKFFEQFTTIYDRIFLKTSCFHCEKLFIDIDVKWVNYDAEINYCFWTWLSIFFHIRENVDDERSVFICVKCNTKSQTSLMIEFWSQKLLSLHQRSRSFLSFLTLHTNLRKISSIEDRSNFEYIYRNMIDSKCSKYFKKNLLMIFQNRCIAFAIFESRRCISKRLKFIFKRQSLIIIWIITKRFWNEQSFDSKKTILL